MFKSVLLDEKRGFLEE